MATPPDTATNTLDDLLRQALAQGASDVHFESGEDFFRARFRIDGLLRIAATPALSLRDAVMSRIKVLARMDIAEKRLPQDGRIQYPHVEQLIDLRVSSLPTLHGEKIVIRILNFSRERPGLAALGYEPDDRAKLVQALGQPHGLILMTGPTGSGKTLSLYSCLELLNRTEVNISTVEDPSEIHLPGANQVNINDRAGLTFATTLRALLRQDPDVIMVGGNSRFRNSRNCHSSRTNRSLGVVHPAHERCAWHFGSLASHGGGCVQCGRQREPDYRAAFGATVMRTLQTAVGYSANRFFLQPTQRTRQPSHSTAHTNTARTLQSGWL